MLKASYLMSTYNICFHEEIGKIPVFFLVEKNALCGAMYTSFFFQGFPRLLIKWYNFGMKNY